LSLQKYSVQAAVTARNDLFTGGQKLAELSRSAAALEGAHAGELQARFASALLTEADYNAVLANRELARVARDRTRRAEEQLAVARARVATGAAVQTDSLQLRLELNRARVVLLPQESALRVSRLGLGRRIGATGPIGADPLWSKTHREVALSQARVNRNVARASREDMDRAVQHDVTAAYDGYVTSRASTLLAIDGLAVARENFRVQRSRYGAGATTILDLLEAEVSLSQAEADLVQSRYATRLALAGLEAI